ncbi:amidohydrolase 2 [Mytilinidion resinicola]|uniref:Amidohydrolase 2 n=1 Tax=Mytilinidion resinicola TaxID=574789 RepID=A0A6A6YFM5_9PEZI|nr:amidohydrolase 2 [Mytilinidion resinicola]KAF2807540.1 amidohydrolase 2 [Mytilinidion resinicola]
MSLMSKDELPEGSWDSHVHVVDEARFPLHELHPYRPQKADLDDFLRFESSQGISHVCLVAFSVYHTDNSSIIDALTRLGGKGRAVVCIDPESITDEELQRLHQFGARGVRLNLRTRGERVDTHVFESLLRQYAKRLRPFGWAIQLYVALDQIDQVADVIPTLGLPVVIDHIGFPDSKKGPAASQLGYEAFMTLLKSGNVWTKLSAVYRFDDLPDLDEYATEILRTAPNRVVWASDWPHSGEYRKVDDHAWIARCKAWCRKVEGGSGENLIRKIWRDNPRALWQYNEDVRHTSLFNESRL